MKLNMIPFKALISRYELPFFAVFIYIVGVMMVYATQLQTFSALYYIGPLLFLYSFKSLNVLNRLQTRNIPWIYWLLMSEVFFMWLRFDINGANGGTFRDINGAGATFLFITIMYRPSMLRLRYAKKWILAIIGVGILYAIYFWKDLVLGSYYISTGGFYGDNGERYVNMAMSVGYALMSCGFLLSIQHVLSPKVKFSVLGAAVLGLIVLMVAGRRGHSVLMLCFIMLFLYSTIIYSKGRQRFYAMIFGTFFIIGSVYYFLANMDTQFGVLMNRIDTDSRTGVFYYWNKEMGTDMVKWIFGKGVSGGYYDGDFCSLRPGIENGIRHMLLKGGVLYLIPYIIIGLKAVYLALRKGRSLFIRMLGLYVLICICFLYVWGTPSFSFLHFCMWVSIVWIYNPQIRRMTDEQIIRHLY